MRKVHLNLFFFYHYALCLQGCYWFQGSLISSVVLKTFIKGTVCICLQYHFCCQITPISFFCCRFVPVIFPNYNSLHSKPQALPALKKSHQNVSFSLPLLLEWVHHPLTARVPTKGCSASWVWSPEVQGRRVSPRRIHSSGLSVRKRS